MNEGVREGGVRFLCFVHRSLIDHPTDQTHNGLFVSPVARPPCLTAPFTLSTFFLVLSLVVGLQRDTPVRTPDELPSIWSGFKHTKHVRPKKVRSKREATVILVRTLLVRHHQEQNQEQD